MPLPAPKSDFIGLPDHVAYLATGGEPPLLKAHRQAFEEFAVDKASAFAGYERHWERVAGVRGKIAGMVNAANAEEVAFTGNTSEGISRIAEAIEWRPGDNAVVSALDYASGRFTIARLRDRGIEARFVPAEEWRQSETAILNHCDERTRYVYVAQVNATTGQHMDIPALSAGLSNSDALLVNDASHAFGAVPVDAGLADFTVWANYKFALGIHDGVMVWNRTRRPDFTPRGTGWWAGIGGATPDRFSDKPDARRFEYGNVGHLGAYILGVSLDYLNVFGIENIAAHNRALSGRLIDGFETLGLEVMTPNASRQRAANAAFVHPEPEALTHRLAAEGIHVWGDNGRLRASAHLFATATDVDRLLDRLPGLLRG